MTLSADVIPGFPGETDEDLSKNLEFFKKADFLHLHIFPYSVREGTEAAQMDCQVPENIKHERAAQLAALQAEIQGRFLDYYIEKHKESPVFVLCEKWENGTLNGHTEHFVECNIPSDCDLTGKTVPVILSGHDGNITYGNIK